MRNANESGIAMITTLLVLMLMSALLVGFTTVVMSDQRYRFIDRDRGQAFYAAGAGVEKLTADLGNLFLQFVAPTAAQVTALTATSAKPVISGITFASPTAPAALPASQLTTYHCNAGGTKTIPVVGTNGYTIRFCANAAGNPTTSDDPLIIGGTGAYAGMSALQTSYQVDVTAKTSTGGEVHLIRTLQTVAIPVFQFMMFSESDLSFFAGANFGFGGRVHTNGNLWLAEGSGATLTMTGKVTAVKDIVRQFLSNGSSIDAGPRWTGAVSLATSSAAPAGNRSLLRTEGSVVGLPGSAAYANWQTVSLGATPANYNGYIKNTATGAKKLSLPLTAAGIGGTNVDIVRRPLTGEDVNGILYNERFFAKTSIRILLSDTAADITAVPGVTATAPVQLDGDWRAAPPNNGTAYGPVDATHPPIARSLGQLGPMSTTTADVVAGATTIPVVATPAMFLKPQLTIKNGTSVVAGPITCTTWTATTFTGCGAHPAFLAGYTIYVSVGGTATAVAGNMPGGSVPSATITASAVNSPTISLTAPETTWQFAANTFFINDVGAGGGGLSTPVTCTGATLTSFTGCTNVPAARTGATITTGYASAQDTGTIGGFIKIEKATAAGAWTDVTMEILNYGIAGPNPGGTCVPQPGAIVQLQRARDNAGAGTCPVGDVTNSYEFWPNVLYDAREGLQRNANPGTIGTGLPMGGAMSYIRIDAKNLAKWFKGQAPYGAGTGATARTDNGGYSVYFSDRRSNRNAAAQETAEYGFEDFVNPGVANGVPNNVCNLPGEDVNENTTCETYGRTPTYDGVFNSVGALFGALSPYSTALTPTSLLKRSFLQVNRPIFFRRALKLVNGDTLGSDAVVANRITGLTVVSENPVYVEGTWNAQATFLVNDLHAATAVIADAVTLMSANWNDANSFGQAYSPGNRVRPAQNYYRLAILSGKGSSFPLPSDETAMQDFGTDGGAHNFLRMLEGGGGTVNYRGSMATLFYNRQAVGTYKCCTTVYGAPVRNFIFDTDFTNPALLPPLTPMFRDLNVVGFSQELRPGK